MPSCRCWFCESDRRNYRWLRRRGWGRRVARDVANRLTIRKAVRALGEEER